MWADAESGDRQRTHHISISHAHTYNRLRVQKRSLVHLHMREYAGKHNFTLSRMRFTESTVCP